jgi:nitroimidazol reductase NimA-like FMN-containing flavoprotein (pyridoxamine 5'-phosphate oxidase superfamily)
VKAGETSEERAPTAGEADERIEAVRSLFDRYHTMSIAAASSPSEPWIAKVFFVDDEPGAGRMDICCAMINTSRKLAMMRGSGRVAFVVAGDHPDRWVQGTGGVEVVDDDADAEAIVKRLEGKSPTAGPFLRMVAWTAVRIHVDRLKYTDITGSPPVCEFTFA